MFFVLAGLGLLTLFVLTLAIYLVIGTRTSGSQSQSKVGRAVVTTLEANGLETRWMITKALILLGLIVTTLIWLFIYARGRGGDDTFLDLFLDLF